MNTDCKVGCSRIMECCIFSSRPIVPYLILLPPSLTYTTLNFFLLSKLDNGSRPYIRQLHGGIFKECCQWIGICSSNLKAIFSKSGWGELHQCFLPLKLKMFWSSFEYGPFRKCLWGWLPRTYARYAPDLPPSPVLRVCKRPQDLLCGKRKRGWGGSKCSR